MPASYSYVLGEAAINFALTLPRKEQHRLALAFRALAAAPHRTGDYSTTDHTGRILHHRLIDDWVVTYWADHAGKELRIVDVAQI